MNFHESRYFNINKQMLKIMGLWPEQSNLSKFLIRAFTYSVYVLFFIPQIMAFNLHFPGDADKTIFVMAVVLYLIAIFLKLLTFTMAEKKVKKMYAAIVENWNLLSDEKELDILKSHSEFGRLLTIGYIAYMYTAGGGFVTLPFIPIFIDYAFPINGTRIRIFILEGEYGVDRYENYGKIYLFEAFTCVATTFIFCALDTTYSATVQQCVGLMAVVKRRLQSATKQIKSVASRGNMDEAYHAMRECIKLHQNAINFATVLEASYTINFLIVLITNSLILSVGAVVIIMNMDKPMEFFRFVLIYIGLFIHMFYLSWPGQRLIDITTELYEDSYTNEWYECSLKAQNLLKFMMLRCKEPTYLTAGGLYVMNFANFGALAKTSMSYITVFSSYR